MTKFMIGKKYYTRSVGDHNCVFDIQVLDRTAKTITISGFSNKRCKLHVDSDGVEYIKPENYSMAPLFRADRDIKPLTDWEK